MAVPVPNAHIIDHAGAHASQMSFSIGLHELQSIILITRWAEMCLSWFSRYLCQQLGASGINNDKLTNLYADCINTAG
jgi:hypothetical protein